MKHLVKGKEVTVSEHFDMFLKASDVVIPKLKQK